MAKKRSHKGKKNLGSAAADRWTLFAPEGLFDKRGNMRKPPCSKTTYTSYGDAAKAAFRCSRSRKTKEPCLLLSGWSAGATKVVGRCFKGKCGKPQEEDRKLLNRCGTGKKDRRAMIKARAERTRSAVFNPDRARGLGRSKRR